MRKIKVTMNMAIVAIAIAALAAWLPAQAVNTASADVISIVPAGGGEKQSVNLENVRNIVFEDGNLVLNTLSGSETITQAIAAVGKVVFEQQSETGIPSVETIGELKFYSPAPNLFTVESPFPIDRIAIYGVDGIICYNSRPAAPTATVDVAALPAGAYLLQVETAKTAVSRKFIKR
jgi:hypothetical protein